MAAVSATIVRAALGSGAARQTAATQMWISVGGHSECSLRDSRAVRSRSSILSISAAALSMSAVFGGQVAYAGVTPNVLAVVGVQTEVAVDRAPSVEVILAKQLARRFREMTDEELVDILQQLLKASGSSFSSQTSVDDGIRPKDLVIQNEKQIKKKSAGPSEEKVPATQEIDTTSRKEAKEKNTVSEAQRANSQGLKESRERNGDGLTLSEATNSGQVDERETQKLSEMAKDQQQQGKDLSTEKGNEGNSSSDARLFETQERLRGGNLASTGPQTAENNAEDMSERSKTSSSDTGLRSAADENVKERTREDEDLTGLLWAEWNRRIGGGIVEEAQPSSTSLNFAEIAQDVIKKVAEFTAFQRAIGVLTFWSFFMFLAYRLGRARASARKDITTSKEARNRNLPIISSDSRARGDMKGAAAILSQGFDFIRDNVNATMSEANKFVSKNERVADSSKRNENFEAGVSPEEGQFSGETELPENGKWWRTPVEEDLLSETKQTSFGDQGNNQLSGHFGPGDSRQDLNYLSQSSQNGTKSPPSSVGSRSDTNDMINLESKQIQGHHFQEEMSRGRRTPLYPSWVSLNSADNKSTELQAAGYKPRQRGSLRPSQADWRNREFRDAGAQRDLEEVSTSDSSDVSAMSKSAIIDSWKGKNHDHRRGISPTGDLRSAGETGTSRMTLWGHMTIKPQKPVDAVWVKNSSRKSDLNEQLKHKDGPEGVSVKAGATDVGGSAASQSDGKLNTFVHDQVLWVRDDDGIFIRQASNTEGPLNITPEA